MFAAGFVHKALPVNSGSSGSSLSGSTDVSTQKSTYLRAYPTASVS
jgi:hypothetical protein